MTEDYFQINTFLSRTRAFMQYRSWHYSGCFDYCVSNASMQVKSHVHVWWREKLVEVPSPSAGRVSMFVIPASSLHPSPVSLCMTWILFLLPMQFFFALIFSTTSNSTLHSFHFKTKLYVNCILWEVHICVYYKIVCTPTVSLQLLQKQCPHVRSKLHVFSFLKQ